MHAHHAGQHICRILLSVTNPGFIFQDRLPRLIETVPVRHFITQTGTNAHFLCSLSDGKQAVLDFAEAGMVVKNRRHAVLNAFHVRRHSAQVRQIIGQMTVNVPPQPVQDI